jgi:hypothetical protein
MTPLFKKLRYTPGARVCVLGAPAGFSAELKRLPKSIECSTSLRGHFDLCHVFVTRQSEVMRTAATLRKALAPEGILWVSYPKGGAIGTDLKRDTLHSLLAELGFDGVAQVAIDDVWSAMRFKVRPSS